MPCHDHRHMLFVASSAVLNFIDEMPTSSARRAARSSFDNVKRPEILRIFFARETQ
jgi:hypothetical protein